MRTLGILSVALLLGSVACGGDPPKVETPPTPSAEPVATTPPVVDPPKVDPPKVDPPKVDPTPPAKKTAKEILEAGGTFMFSLADSADAKKLVHDGCEKTAKKDAKKLEACNKDAEASAANEGIRFEKDTKGAWWYTSFGKEKDKEVVYIKGAFKVAKAEGDKITVNPEGKMEGKMANKPAPKEVSFDIPDESTVKMTDPGGKKGVLVYKKK